MRKGDNKKAQEHNLSFHDKRKKRSSAIIPTPLITVMDKLFVFSAISKVGMTTTMTGQLIFTLSFA